MKASLVSVFAAVVILGSALGQSSTVTFLGEELEVFRIEHAFDTTTLAGVRSTGTLYIDCMDILDAPDRVEDVRARFASDLVLFCMATPSEDAIGPEFNPIFVQYQIGPSVFRAEWLNARWHGSGMSSFRPNEVKMVFLPVPRVTRGEPFTLWFRDDSVEAVLEKRER